MQNAKWRIRIGKGLPSVGEKKNNPSATASLAPQADPASAFEKTLLTSNVSPPMFPHQCFTTNVSSPMFHHQCFTTNVLPPVFYHQCFTTNVSQPMFHNQYSQTNVSPWFSNRGMPKIWSSTSLFPHRTQCFETRTRNRKLFLLVAQEFPGSRIPVGLWLVEWYIFQSNAAWTEARK